MSSESHHMCVNGRASRAELSDESQDWRGTMSSW